MMEDVYNRSPYKTDVAFADLKQGSDEYKRIRENFVTGFHGGSLIEILAITTVPAVSIHMCMMTVSFLKSNSEWFSRIRSSKSDNDEPKGLSIFEYLFNILFDCFFSCFPLIIIVFYPEFVVHFYVLASFYMFFLY